MIVETHPQYAAQHQLAVMDCLEGGCKNKRIVSCMF